MAPVIGIDLGTSNTCVATVLHGEVKAIPDERGRTVMPSVVTQNKHGRFVVGHFARAQQLTNPYETIFSVKRLLGQQYHNEEMERVRRYLSYPLEPDPSSGGVVVKLRDQTFTPVEISTQILLKAKENAERLLGQAVEQAVITVPAHFNDLQRKETKRAGEAAGLDVLRLINEPTAAALAFGFGSAMSTRVAVFDFGGGTFDVSILNIEGNLFEVVSTGGDSYLGGDDLNWRVVDYLAAEFLASDNINLKMDKMAMQRLFDAAEQAKIDLSAQEQVVVDLPRIAPSIDINAHLHVSLSRAQLESMTQDLVQRAFRICEATFQAASLGPGDVDQVLMVGGQSRMPLVQRMARDFFKAPCNNSINPDEVVAIGAAIQAQALQEDRDDTLLLDVTPLTLGIRGFRDIFVPIIPKNTKVPHRVTKVFTTSNDNQEQVRIRISQGENKVASSNQLLGEFLLAGIQPAPRMEPRIEVSFRIDSNGILDVGAKDLQTGEETGLMIDNYGEIAAAGAADESAAAAPGDATTLLGAQATELEP